MRWRTYLSGLGLLAALGCGPLSNTNAVTGTSGSTGTEGAVDGTSNRLEVMAIGTSFSASNLIIDPGQTVTWRNADAIAHTVTSGYAAAPSGLFDKTLQPGETFSYTFRQPGTFQFFCRQHAAAGMVGSIQVRGSSGSTGSGLGRRVP